MVTIAVDLGGTRSKVGFIEKGKLLFTSKLEAHPNRTIEDTLEDISLHVEPLLREHGLSQKDLGGIGICFPGIVDSRINRVVSKYVKYTNADAFDFHAWGMKRWDLPAVVENDAHAALLGEWMHGAGKGYNNIVLLTLGTGVGSAVMLEGKMLKGTNSLAGNMAGHMSVNSHGHACNCGFFGCLESEASTWVLPEKARRYPEYKDSALAALPQLEFAQLFEHADRGDALAKKLVDDCLQNWGVCAVNMVHAYDPEVIVVGGGIMKRSERILPFMQNMVDRYSWLEPGTTKIIGAQQIEYAGLLGVDYLVSKLNIGVR